MQRKILIYNSQTENSISTKKLLSEKIIAKDFTIVSELDSEVELIVCIGGDGTFLDLIHEFDFPEIPIIGINTGHLGFFQEIMPDRLDEFIDNYINQKYSIQSMQTVMAHVYHDGICEEFKGLNEIIIASNANYAYSVHFDISIAGSFIERFSGDGLLVSTPAGSTAYNYSLGGSIVDPRLRLLQATPIAPMNTTAYRSFTSSILLPPDLSMEVKPVDNSSKVKITIAFDGFSKFFDNVSNIEVCLSETNVKLLRLESYDFWSKVKSKFL